jgi:hypothetical protein
VRYARETVDLAIECADAYRRDDLVERGARDLLSEPGGTVDVVGGWIAAFIIPTTPSI